MSSRTGPTSRAAFSLIELPAARKGKAAARLSSPKSGFTLIELMVVIGIIAILIALLLPTLTRVRQSANTVKCAAQLRQIGQGIMSYASGNGGLLPAWSGNHSYPDDIKTDDPLGPGWIVLIERHVGVKPDSPLYTCPAYPGQDRAITYFLAARYTGGRLPYNSSMPISHIKLSSQFVLSGDVTNLYWYRPPLGDWNRDFDNTDKDDNMERCVSFFGEANGMNMHGGARGGGINLLFADGHVAPFRKFDPQAITYHPTELRNWDQVERQD